MSALTIMPARAGWRWRRSLLRIARFGLIVVRGDAGEVLDPAQVKSWCQRVHRRLSTKRTSRRCEGVLGVLQENATKWLDARDVPFGWQPEAPATLFPLISLDKTNDSSIEGQHATLLSRHRNTAMTEEAEPGHGKA